MLNLYTYYEQPDTLPLYGTVNKALQYVSKTGDWGEKIFEKDLEPITQIIKKQPKKAYQYARQVIRKRWPEAEPYIVKDPEYACYYARDLFKGRWEDAEHTIAQDPRCAAIYAKYVLAKDSNYKYENGRFPEAEPYIITDAYYSYYYAREILKGRWPEAEPTIMKEPNIASYYAFEVMKQRWPEAEKYIKQDWSSWNDYKAVYNIER